MKYHVEMCEDLGEPIHGSAMYWVALGPGTGAPWNQHGFTTKHDAESACELLETVYQETINAAEKVNRAAFAEADKATLEGAEDGK